MQEVGGEREGVRAHRAKDRGQKAGELVHLCDEDGAVERLVVSGLDETYHLSALKPGQLERCRGVQALGVEAAVGRGEHADVAGQKAVQLHVADGSEAVEPGVGHL